MRTRERETMIEKDRERIQLRMNSLIVNHGCLFMRARRGRKETTSEAASIEHTTERAVDWSSRPSLLLGVLLCVAACCLLLPPRCARAKKY
jgi:hypothetical protein